ncbi:MAG: hypothetical protein ACFFBE_14940 [Promethearchaeota archaeon]
MPGLTHIGIAFMVQVIVPHIPIWVLIIASEFIDIIFIIFWVLKIEEMPTKETAGNSPYSHGLFMSLIWTILAALITFFISNDLYITFIIGGLVFSHWILDFVASPMTYVYPNDTGLPIFFKNSRKIGLGLWNSKRAIIIGEYGVTVVGIIIYIIWLIV